MDFSSQWVLDPEVAYLNHGSYGACPRSVLGAQSRLRLEMEREPVDFLSKHLPARLDAARLELAAFLGADAADLAFVSNATSGVNAVLRSLSFAAGDELLVTSHTYAACRKAVDYVCSRSGARVVVAELPFPCHDAGEIVTCVLDAVSPRTRLALLDHVTSPSALVLPIAELIQALRARGVDALVDGAHAPGMVPLALDGLGAAYYTGNAHKWLCAPKGAAFLHVRRDRQSALHPNVISHGYAGGFQAEFDWTGTFDPSAWLCIPEAIRCVGGMVPGGWPQVMAMNHTLALEARQLLCEVLEVPPPCPASMIGSIASVPLPPATVGAPAHGRDTAFLHDWFRERGIETWLYPSPLPLLRVSAQLYNRIDQFALLATLLKQALRGV